ncbi:MAG: CRISPR-associated endonuclease Cas1, partial [Planctomycetota bacterium]|nr:CRISPR-associated endonuclease Cas1 [Planctomycetota bacterium]
MEINLNTLFVMSQGAFVHRDGMTVKVDIEKETRLAVPIHTLESVAVFGNVMVSPGMLNLCAESGVAVSFFKSSGRLIARVDAPTSGNVLLRREQFRWADRPARCLEIARNIVAGKLQNTRTLLLRSARESNDDKNSAGLARAATSVAGTIEALPRAHTLDEIRGHEGEAAKTYFDVFTHMIRADGDAFAMTRRTRRPPLDRINALLGFAYALLLHDCCAALTASGLDPSVGFLHADRPGKPSLGLDLMEEFRPLIADRLVLALINRRQIQADDFRIRDGRVVV